MSGNRILLILEDPKERIEYTEWLESWGFLVDSLPQGNGAMEILLEKKPAMVIVDETTSRLSILDFLSQCLEACPQCRVLVTSPEAQVEQAVSLMKAGALDYLIRPLDSEQLELIVRNFAGASQAGNTPKNKSSNSKGISIVTKDPVMKGLVDLVERVADSSASVFIQGESGTGKELFAQLIHEKSNRSAGPFIAINCAALPENLLESELFGHEKGAFTGAISRKAGKFEMAHQGTLFLDEITEMQIHLQAKLLRVLQEKIVDRVGGSQGVPVDVRVLASTNREPEKSVEQGQFRQDLYYRLNTIPVVIPPLRDRQGDLALLCDFFIKKYAEQDHRPVTGISSQALSILEAHGFPGNVRELENIIHRAVLLASSSKIKPEDLLMDGVPRIQPQAASSPKAEEPCEEASPPASASHTMDMGTGSLKEMEQHVICKTLDQTQGNRTHAAKILGISVRTLRNKLNEYGLS